MAIHWTETLATGLSWQDEEHREIFGHIGNLLDAMESNRAGDVVGELFDFLDGYVIMHFGHEEAFMEQSQMPSRRRHMDRHQEFRDQLKELRTTHARQGASTYLIMHLQRWLREFVLDHIARLDKELAAQVKASEQAAKRSASR
jgi:hemerythrin